MIQELTYRKAVKEDLSAIIKLLIQDDLGSEREDPSKSSEEKYLRAFEDITHDKDQFLMVVIYHEEVIGTCHLTLMPSLTFQGSLRLQIEAVRVSKQYRGNGIGRWMIEKAIEYGKAKNAKIIQLSSNKIRKRAMDFYLSLGFVDTHVGMKLYVG